MSHQSTELLPCPFCGIVIAEKQPRTEYFTHPVGECFFSGYEFDVGGNPAIATQWNARTIASVKREPLSRKAISDIFDDYELNWLGAARAIEQAHGIGAGVKDPEKK